MCDSHSLLGYFMSSNPILLVIFYVLNLSRDLSLCAFYPISKLFSLFHLVYIHTIFPNASIFMSITLVIFKSYPPFFSQFLYDEFTKNCKNSNLEKWSRQSWGNWFDVNKTFYVDIFYHFFCLFPLHDII
jgi:hypothetical protein